VHSCVLAAMRTALYGLALGLAFPIWSGSALAKPSPGPVPAGKPVALRTPTAKVALAAPGPKASAVSPAKGKVAAKSSRKRPPPPCFAPPVRVVRQRGGELEERSLALTYCDGRPNPRALDELSVVARPKELPFAPTPAEIAAYAKRPLDRGPLSRRRDPLRLTESVLRLHPELLVRLQQVAGRFPGKTIEIVSGHRPEARSTSRHHHGRALDMRVEGVSRERLRDFARSLEATGVGYYPNSVFVHLDVREDKGYWVDRSGPGEPADYGPWPPRPRELANTREAVLASAYAELGSLSTLALADTAKRGSGGHVPALPSEPPIARPISHHVAEPAPATRPARAQPKPPPAEEDAERPLSAAEVAKIRAEALKALAALR